MTMTFAQVPDHGQVGEMHTYVIERLAQLAHPAPLPGRHVERRRHLVEISSRGRPPARAIPTRWRPPLSSCGAVGHLAPERHLVEQLKHRRR
jgi:hypothetical protein